MKIVRFASCSLIMFCVFMLSGLSAPFIKTNHGIILYPSHGPARAVRLDVVSENIIRVSASPVESFSTKPSLMTLPYAPGATWTLSEDSSSLRLATSSLNVIVSKQTGQVRFADKAGKNILTEVQDGRSIKAEQVDGETLYQISQRFQSPAEEAFYGLGQHQEGVMNYRGENVVLLQQNSDVAVPFLLSSYHYGILWDNYSITHFTDGRSYSALSGLSLFDKSGKPGGLTASYFEKGQQQPFVERSESDIRYNYLCDMPLLPKNYKMQGGQIVWEGSLASNTTGKHQFKLYTGGYIKVWLNGELVADSWRQSWNAATTRFDLQMEPGKKYPIKIEWKPDGGESYCGLTYLPPATNIQKSQFEFNSEAGRQIDYYLIAGQNADEVIAGYRRLTGKATLLPKWAYGFWQSRERYKTEDEIIQTVAEYRKRKIGLDNIVLDWSYWKQDQWGSHEFEPSRFPDPAAMISKLHDQYHTQFMISVWPKFYVNTNNYQLFNNKGWMYKDNVIRKRRDWIADGYLSSFYDAYNADARQLFWNLMNKQLYSKGVDAWWMDATEPDIHSNVSIEERKDFMNPTAMGSSTEYFNGFALENARGVYEGQRSVDPNKRVFILTRSAYAGMQRYAAATWSGDIGARWRDMKNQIAAGVNFGMSGMPYWTQDIGGFAVEKRYEQATGDDLEEWREQFTRWFQFGAFNPIFRAHGQFPYREIYHVAPEGTPAYASMLYYNQLRYRLLPYIYSLAGQTYLHDYTIMRGLMMDFPDDVSVRNINDEYMFGPAFLVNPVTSYKAVNRRVYLPATQGWYHAYTGEFEAGGKLITANAPYDRMPLFIKAGSIIPMGPDIQYTSEKPADTLTLFVYKGADGYFNLYEDDGLNYDYEKGQYSIIPFTWNEKSNTLSMGDRSGSYQGMIANRTIKVIVVNKKQPKALDPDQPATATIAYTGKSTSIQLK